MIRKRIKRVLRAIGLVKPHNPAAVAGKRGQLNQAQARVVVTELYRAILKCEPAPQSRDIYATQLASGALSQVDVVRALMESGDFGTAASRHENVASNLSAAVLSTLLRNTDEAAITVYARGLAGGLPVADFIREICGSAEFRTVWGAGAPSGASLVAPLDATTSGLLSTTATSAVSSEIGQMVEGLIAARMIGEGAVLGLPPVNAIDRPAVSARQMMSLIRTLDMLADRPAG